MSKHFISVLGTGNYSKTMYCYGEKKYETAYIQEAILELEVFKLEDGDKITVFLTEGAKKKNWNDRAYEEYEIQAAERRNEKLPPKKEGLETVLMRKYEPYMDDIECCMIPMGANEEELWTIFQVIFDRIREREELYIDITHALRNIPIQMLAVISYARVIKNIQVNGIYYGAFEVGNLNEQGIKEAPVMDLLTFLDILDWSQAANSFVKYGNSDQIEELYEAQKNRTDIRKTEMNKLIREMQNITHGLETSRGYYNHAFLSQNKNGKSILESYKQYKETYQIMTNKDNRLQERSKKQKNMIEPLGELLNVMNQKMERFDVETNLELGLAAINWAIENKRTQQGFTALEETVKTFLCNYYGFDETQELYRDKICKSICISLYKKINEKEGGVLTDEVRRKQYEEWMEERKEMPEITDEDQCKIKEMCLTLPENLMSLCQKIGNCRNSMNHFGYSNKGVYSSSLLEENLSKYFLEFKEVIRQMDTMKKN